MKKKLFFKIIFQLFHALIHYKRIIKVMMITRGHIRNPASEFIRMFCLIQTLMEMYFNMLYYTFMKRDLWQPQLNKIGILLQCVNSHTFLDLIYVFTPHKSLYKWAKKSIKPLIYTIQSASVGHAVLHTLFSTGLRIRVATTGAQKYWPG